MSNYWEKRAARQMHQQMQKTEEYLDELAEYYMAASLDLQAKAKDILRKFRLKHNLSEYEAERILANIDPADIKGILERLAKDPKNKAIKDELTTQAAAARIRNLETIFEQVKKATESLAERLQKGAKSLLKKLGLESWYKAVFNLQKRAGSGWKVNKVSDKIVEKAIKRSWAGSGFSERIWGNTEELEKAVKKEIMKSLLTGRPTEEAARAINDQFGKGMFNARRLVRTETAYITNQMTLEGYKSQGVEKYVYVAILDLKTSKVCRGLDKKRFLVKNAQVGVNFPPMHPFCRSTTVPWVSDALLRRMKQRALDPKTGKRVLVPGDMTYDEWYKQFVQGQPAGQPAGNQTTQTVGSGTASVGISTGRNDTAFAKVPGTNTSTAYLAQKTEHDPRFTYPHKGVRTYRDVTREYINEADPGRGLFTIEKGVTDDSIKEKATAEWIHNNLGGDITVKEEVHEDFHKNPDYEWMGMLWDLKSPSTEKAANGLIKKGMKQIKNNPGGIILNYGDYEFDEKMLMDVIDERMHWYPDGSADILIISKGKLYKALRY